jgi:predicted transcriptional regulator
MTAAPQIELQPLEWAIVAALRERGTLTTSELVAHIAAEGIVCSRASLRARLHTLTRFCVVVRVREGLGLSAGPHGPVESSYRLRLP